MSLLTPEKTLNGNPRPKLPNLEANYSEQINNQFEVLAGKFNEGFSLVSLRLDANGDLKFQKSVMQNAKDAAEGKRFDGTSVMARNLAQYGFRFFDNSKLDVNAQPKIVQLLKMVNDLKSKNFKKEAIKKQIQNYLKSLNPVVRDELLHKMVARGFGTTNLTASNEKNNEETLDLLAKTSIALVDYANKNVQETNNKTEIEETDRDLTKIQSGIDNIALDHKGKRVLEGLDESGRLGGGLPVMFRTMFNKLLPASQYLLKSNFPLFVWGQFQEALSGLLMADQSVIGVMSRMQNIIKFAQINKLSQVETCQLIIKEGQILQNIMAQKSQKMQNLDLVGKSKNIFSKIVSMNTLKDGSLHNVDGLQEEISAGWTELSTFMEMINNTKKQLIITIQNENRTPNPDEIKTIENFDNLSSEFANLQENIPQPENKQSEVINRLIQEPSENKAKETLGKIGKWFGKKAEWIGQKLQPVADKITEKASPIINKVDQFGKNSDNSVVSAIYGYFNSDVYSQRDSAKQIINLILKDRSKKSNLLINLREGIENIYVQNVINSTTNQNELQNTLQILAKKNPEIIIKASTGILSLEELANIADLSGIRTQMNTMKRQQNIAVSLVIAKMQTFGFAKGYEIGYFGGSGLRELVDTTTNFSGQGKNWGDVGLGIQQTASEVGQNIGQAPTGLNGQTLAQDLQNTFGTGNSANASVLDNRDIGNINIGGQNVKYETKSGELVIHNLNGASLNKAVETILQAFYQDDATFDKNGQPVILPTTIRYNGRNIRINGGRNLRITMESLNPTLSAIPAQSTNQATRLINNEKGGDKFGKMEMENYQNQSNYLQATFAEIEKGINIIAKNNPQKAQELRNAFSPLLAAKNTTLDLEGLQLVQAELSKFAKNNGIKVDKLLPTLPENEKDYTGKIVPQDPKDNKFFGVELPESVRKAGETADKKFQEFKRNTGQFLSDNLSLEKPANAAEMNTTLFNNKGEIEKLFAGDIIKNDALRTQVIDQLYSLDQQMDKAQTPAEIEAVRTTYNAQKDKITSQLNNPFASNFVNVEEMRKKIAIIDAKFAEVVKAKTAVFQATTENTAKPQTETPATKTETGTDNTIFANLPKDAIVYIEGANGAKGDYFKIIDGKRTVVPLKQGDTIFIPSPRTGKLEQFTYGGIKDGKAVWVAIGQIPKKGGSPELIAKPVDRMAKTETKPRSTAKPLENPTNSQVKIAITAQNLVIYEKNFPSLTAKIQEYNQAVDSKNAAQIQTARANLERQIKDSTNFVTRNPNRFEAKMNEFNQVINQINQSLKSTELTTKEPAKAEPTNNRIPVSANEPANIPESKINLSSQQLDILKKVPNLTQFTTAIDNYNQALTTKNKIQIDQRLKELRTQTTKIHEYLEKEESNQTMVKEDTGLIYTTVGDILKTAQVKTTEALIKATKVPEQKPTAPTNQTTQNPVSSWWANVQTNTQRKLDELQGKTPAAETPTLPTTVSELLKAQTTVFVLETGQYRDESGQVIAPKDALKPGNYLVDVKLGKVSLVDNNNKAQLVGEFSPAEVKTAYDNALATQSAKPTEQSGTNTETKPAPNSVKPDEAKLALEKAQKEIEELKSKSGSIDAGRSFEFLSVAGLVTNWQEMTASLEKSSAQFTADEKAFLVKIKSLDQTNNSITLKIEEAFQMTGKLIEMAKKYNTPIPANLVNNIQALSRIDSTARPVAANSELNNEAKPIDTKIIGLPQETSIIVNINSSGYLFSKTGQEIGNIENSTKQNISSPPGYEGIYVVKYKNGNDSIYRLVAKNQNGTFVEIKEFSDSNSVRFKLNGKNVNPQELINGLSENKLRSELKAELVSKNPASYIDEKLKISENTSLESAQTRYQNAIAVLSNQSFEASTAKKGEIVKFSLIGTLNKLADTKNTHIRSTHDTSIVKSLIIQIYNQRQELRPLINELLIAAYSAKLNRGVNNQISNNLQKELSELASHYIKQENGTSYLAIDYMAQQEGMAEFGLSSDLATGVRASIFKFSESFMLSDRNTLNELSVGSSTILKWRQWAKGEGAARNIPQTQEQGKILLGLLGLKMNGANLEALRVADPTLRGMIQEVNGVYEGMQINRHKGAFSQLSQQAHRAASSIEKEIREDIEIANQANVLINKPERQSYLDGNRQVSVGSGETISNYEHKVKIGLDLSFGNVKEVAMTVISGQTIKFFLPIKITETENGSYKNPELTEQDSKIIKDGIRQAMKEIPIEKYGLQQPKNPIAKIALNLVISKLTSGLPLVGMVGGSSQEGIIQYTVNAQQLQGKVDTTTKLLEGFGEMKPGTSERVIKAINEDNINFAIDIIAKEQGLSENQVQDLKATITLSNAYAGGGRAVGDLTVGGNLDNNQSVEVNNGFNTYKVQGLDKINIPSFVSSGNRNLFEEQTQGLVNMGMNSATAKSAFDYLWDTTNNRSRQINSSEIQNLNAKYGENGKFVFTQKSYANTDNVVIKTNEGDKILAYTYIDKKGEPRGYQMLLYPINTQVLEVKNTQNGRIQLYRIGGDGLVPCLNNDEVIKIVGNQKPEFSFDCNTSGICVPSVKDLPNPSVEVGAANVIGRLGGSAVDKAGSIAFGVMLRSDGYRQLDFRAAAKILERNGKDYWTRATAEEWFEAFRQTGYKEENLNGIIGKNSQGRNVTLKEFFRNIVEEKDKRQLAAEIQSPITQKSVIDINSITTTRINASWFQKIKTARWTTERKENAGQSSRLVESKTDVTKVGSQEVARERVFTGSDGKPQFIVTNSSVSNNVLTVAPGGSITLPAGTNLTSSNGLTITSNDSSGITLQNPLNHDLAIGQYNTQTDSGFIPYEDIVSNLVSYNILQSSLFEDSNFTKIITQNGKTTFITDKMKISINVQTDTKIIVATLEEGGYRGRYQVNENGELVFNDNECAKVAFKKATIGLFNLSENASGSLSGTSNSQNTKVNETSRIEEQKTLRQKIEQNNIQRIEQAKQQGQQPFSNQRNDANIESRPTAAPGPVVTPPVPPKPNEPIPGEPPLDDPNKPTTPAPDKPKTPEAADEPEETPEPFPEPKPELVPDPVPVDKKPVPEPVPTLEPEEPPATATPVKTDIPVPSKQDEAPAVDPKPMTEPPATATPVKTDIPVPSKQDEAPVSDPKEPQPIPPIQAPPVRTVIPVPAPQPIQNLTPGLQTQPLPTAPTIVVPPAAPPPTPEKGGQETQVDSATSGAKDLPQSSSPTSIGQGIGGISGPTLDGAESAAEANPQQP